MHGHVLVINVTHNVVIVETRQCVVVGSDKLPITRSFDIVLVSCTWDIWF